MKPSRFLAGKIGPGLAREVPRILVERLVRFHLLDNVRGQTSPFPVRDQGRDTDQPPDGD
jgi:hypothetical protein